MSIRVLQLPVWQDNYAYVLLPDEGGAALVDSPEAAPVIELLEREGRRCMPCENDLLENFRMAHELQADFTWKKISFSTTTAAK